MCLKDLQMVRCHWRKIQAADIFSTLTIEGSLKDDYRYNANYWDPWQISNK